MKNSLFPSNENPGKQLLTLIFYCLLSFALFTAFALFTGSFLFDVSLLKMDANISVNSPTNELAFFKYVQAFNALGLFVAPPLLAYWLSKKSFSLSLGYTMDTKSLWLTALMMVVALPLINFLVSINQGLTFPDFLAGIENWMIDSEKRAEKITKAFLKMNTPWDLFVNLIVIAVIPALGEELLFRSSLQPIFSRLTKNHHAGIWLTAIIFSAFHLQFFGFLPRLLLGALFGYLLFYSKSVWLPVVAHFTNNGFAVIVSYFVQDKLFEEDIEKLGEQGHLPVLAIASTILVVLLFTQIKKGAEAPS